MVDPVVEQEKEAQEHTLLSDISRRVDNLANSIRDGESSGVLRQIIDRINAEQAQIPPDAKESGMVSGAANDARKKAEDLKEKKEAEEIREVAETIAVATSAGLMTASAADMAFSKAMLQFMNTGEQQFFNNLQGSQSLVMLDSHGQPIVGQNSAARIEQVDGSLLQADFAHIKYHTLDKTERDQIPIPPGESPDGKKLHESLLRLEGLHIHRNMEAGMSLEEAQSKCHEDFTRAHDQVNSTVAVEATAHALEDAAKKNPLLAMNAKIAGLAAKYHEDKLGADFQKVVDDIAGSEVSQRRHEQGIEVSGPTAQLHLSTTHKEPELSRH